MEIGMALWLNNIFAMRAARRLFTVRPEGDKHEWSETPPGKLSMGPWRESPVGWYRAGLVHRILPGESD